jgi:hypothetical protein
MYGGHLKRRHAVQRLVRHLLRTGKILERQAFSKSTKWNRVPRIAERREHLLVEHLLRIADPEEPVLETARLDEQPPLPGFAKHLEPQIGVPPEKPFARTFRGRELRVRICGDVYLVRREVVSSTEKIPDADGCATRRQIRRRIALIPCNMRNNVSVGGIASMTMQSPVRRFQMHLDIPLDSAAIAPELKNGMAEIRS